MRKMADWEPNMATTISLYHQQELVESRLVLLPCHPASTTESEICFDAGDLSGHPLTISSGHRVYSCILVLYLMLPLRR
ncbi:unnamed protein product [Urochloa humidicola]